MCTRNYALPCPQGKQTVSNQEVSRFAMCAGYSPQHISYNEYAEADGITCSADIFYEGQVQTTCKHVLVLIHLMSVRTANTI